MEAIYNIKGLSKSYGSNRVLVELDFEVYRGESLIILGRSGSGKSVTLAFLPISFITEVACGTCRIDLVFTLRPIPTTT